MPLMLYTLSLELSPEYFSLSRMFRLDVVSPFLIVAVSSTSTGASLALVMLMLMDASELASVFPSESTAVYAKESVCPVPASLPPWTYAAVPSDLM